MIQYEQDRYGFKLLFMRKGSVFPGAAKFAIVPALISLGIRIVCGMIEFSYDTTKLSTSYGNFVFVLGFALVFRSSSGYSRYWDGANLLRQMRTEWHDACAQVCCFAMCSDKSMEEKDAFKGCIVRLFSLLHCLALQQVADMEDESFEVIDLEALDTKLLKSLKQFHEPLEKAEIVVNWIQRVILEGAKAGFVTTPPPIVSRSFQEINSGMVCLSKLQAITDNPFPFPYAQMVSAMLIVHFMVTPVLIGTLPVHWALSFMFTFISVFALCSLNLIAQEIENPFGDDENDLRCDEAQMNMNEALILLLSEPASALPNFATPASKSKAKSRQTKRLSCFLPIGEDSVDPADFKFGAVSSETANSKRTSFVKDRGGASVVAKEQARRSSTASTGRVSKVKFNKDKEEADEDEPDSPEVVNIAIGNAKANSAGPVASPPPPAPPPPIPEKEVAPPTLDIWAHLEESSKRAESLQSQSISELKEVHSMLGQLVKMVSQGLSLASDAGVVIRQADSGPVLRTTAPKCMSEQSDGSCRLFPSRGSPQDK